MSHKHPCCRRLALIHIGETQQPCVSAREPRTETTQGKSSSIYAGKFNDAETPESGPKTGDWREAAIEAALIVLGHWWRSPLGTRRKRLTVGSNDVTKNKQGEALPWRHTPYGATHSVPPAGLNSWACRRELGRRGTESLVRKHAYKSESPKGRA